ncbi:MAG: sigma-70 family RNA polymerase sigma factor [Bacteroidota bacterium]
MINTKCDVPAFWAEHETVVFAYIRKRIPNRTLAEDLRQEVLLKVYDFCTKRSGVKNPKAWLYQIAHNVIMDHHRQDKRERQVLANIPETDLPPSGLIQATSCFNKLMARMDQEDQEIIRWIDIDGQKQKEVANKLGLSLSGAKSRIQRARKRLHAKFTECCEWEMSHQGSILGMAPKAGCPPEGVSC